MTLREAKRVLRRESAARRREAEVSAEAHVGDRLAEHFLASVPLAARAAVSGYWPIRGEIDPRPLMRRLHASGHACALPVMAGTEEPLVFRAWAPEVLLEENAYGIPEPPARAPQVVPDVLLVPLLAFDAEGYRLGYGGGYYDRTIALLRASPRAVLAVGLAYALQRVTRLPRGPGDERLDWVVSEEEAREIR